MILTIIEFLKVVLYGCSFVEKLSWKKKIFFWKNICVFDKIYITEKNVFLWKKVLYWKLFLLKKKIFTEKNINENVKNIYLTWKIYFYTENVCFIKYCSTNKI